MTEPELETGRAWILDGIARTGSTERAFAAALAVATKGEKQIARDAIRFAIERLEARQRDLRARLRELRDQHLGLDQP